MTQQSGYFFAVAGGLAAQAPDATVGNAGLVIGVAGLIAGCFRAWLDYRSSMKRLEIQEDKTEALTASLKSAENKAKALEMSLAATAQELADARERTHTFQNHTSAVVTDMAAQVMVNTHALQASITATKDLAVQSGIATSVPEPPPTILANQEERAKPD